MKADSVLNLVGSTPLIRWGQIGDAVIWVKMEGCNPSGSLKDRHARSILDGLIARGELIPGRRLLSASSGSFATATALRANILGWKTTAVVNAKISKVNAAFLEFLGADIIRCGTVTADCQTECERMVAEAPELYVFADQLRSPDAAKAHESTADEILADLPDVTAVVASIGSGATILGLDNRFLERGADVHLFASIGVPGDKGKFAGTFVEGVDYLTPFIREIDRRGCVERFAIGFDEGMVATRELGHRGILVGPQAGGVFLAAKQAVQKYGVKGNVVCIAGDSYLKNSDRF